jgi:hypothetical protein
MDAHARGVAFRIHLRRGLGARTGRAASRLPARDWIGKRVLMLEQAFL